MRRPVASCFVEARAMAALLTRRNVLPVAHRLSTPIVASVRVTT
jgi:hypothetical protein